MLTAPPTGTDTGDDGTPDGRGITGESGPLRRPVLLALLRTLGSVVIVLLAYYLLPLDRRFGMQTFGALLAGVLLVGALVAYQVRQILRARYPVLRAIESLALTVPLFLVLFATAYVVLDGTDPGAFSERLTRTDALYFVVTVFATVGFGDITAVSETARVLVTLQMVGDLVVLGLVVRAVLGAVRRTAAPRHRPTAEPPPDRPDA